MYLYLLVTPILTWRLICATPCVLVYHGLIIVDEFNNSFIIFFVSENKQLEIYRVATTNGHVRNDFKT